MAKAVGEVRKLNGLLSYYRRYISDFAKIAKPLIDPIKDTEKGDSRHGSVMSESCNNNVIMLIYKTG